MITNPYSAYAAAMSRANCGESAAPASSVGTSSVTRLLCLPAPGCRSRRMPPVYSQVSGAILMVRPKHFGFNAEAALTNRFQQAGPSVDVSAPARAEFDAFAGALAAEGVNVCVAEDTDEPSKPDAVFPNNWVSFHADGTVVLYPMEPVSRRAERRAAI